MNIMFLGVPSSGKGTQAEFVRKKYKLAHLSIGELLRKKIDDPNDPEGQDIREKINKGILVDNDLIMRIIETFISNLSSDEGILFDGFPRSVEQAILLDKLFEKLNKKLDCVINMELDDRVVMERINGRRLCPNCGKSYHIKFNPSKIKDTCDDCGSKLVIREDDNEESVKGRLKTYYSQTHPLINYYKEQGKLIGIDATQDIESIAKNIDDILGGIQ